MDLSAQTCTEFLDTLASKAPVPGGGGASALVGAIGIALGNMVGNLTVGKKKYADVEADVIALDEKAAALRQRLVDLVAADAAAFEPLSRAYGLPKDTEEQKAHKAQVMAQALDAACAVPLDIMRAACEAIDLHSDYARMGSAIAISDVGVGAVCCKAALQGASLNVFINTKSMADRDKAAQLERQANAMLDRYCPLADAIFANVAARFHG
ncbi:sugar ABC transporter substrate-binding protein [Pseudoflavonifractor sp. 524-17]|uniref:cyclodeaminase/cyclohydrolase family protein n=1 Tax=Pseudoflavonifractor sp. 524-17 TaxID=2304577 RepID=UPI00137B73FD|nr:cyclodeaminase/cyclohydrolase family protein [Pseudoflavonifractor sp. 524-17]NCE63976.1 sugar ABC transporter substrate-binding protein [Pseudoflavonifractor sp. 524-17]